MRRSLVNYVGFQAGWFACVMGAGHGVYWLGPLVASVLLTLHTALSPSPRAELRRLLAVAAFGLALEAVALSFGRYAYAGGFLSGWVVALWLLLAATLESSLAWLAERPVLAALIGAAAGPLSFRAGVGLGAGIYLAEPAQASAVLAALWAVALPGAFIVSRRFS